MKLSRLFIATAASALALSTAVSRAHADTGYYQYPVAHGDTLVFASEGDLWRAPRGGGSAIRLTNHVEEESSPRISPDGTMIAFNAAYDSPNDVYVMPITGGAPKRLTFAGGGMRAVGWTPDGRVMVQNRFDKGDYGQVIYTVAATGGELVPIPLWRVTEAAYGSDGKTLFFTRRGIAGYNDNAAQYRGGAVAQLWRWSGEGEAVRMLADFAGPVVNLMVHSGRIWFTSDEGGGEALWSVAEDGTGVRRESEMLPLPIRQASMSDGTVYLQNGADIHAFDSATKALRKLDLAIVTDREQTRQRAIDKPLRFLTAAAMAPSGQSVAVTARGRVAVGFPKERRRIELPIPLDARAREAQLSPDGKTVFLLLDRNLAGGIYRMPADGSAPPVAITKGGTAHIWSLAVSPDGKTIVFDDKSAQLSTVDVASGTVTRLAKNDTGSDRPFQGVRFSPDGRHIAYAEDNDGGSGARGIIMVQTLADGRRVAASSTRYNDYSPAFSADGKWLYFLSDRNFAPNPPSPWGDRNMGVSFPDRGEIFAVQLDPGADFPFANDTELTGTEKPATETPPSSDSKPATDDAEKGKDGKKAPAKLARVVLEGLSDRLYKVPGAKAMTGALFAGEKHLYAGRGEDEVVSIAISKDDPKVETFARGVRGFDLSADRKTAFVMTGAPDNPSLLLVPAGEKMPDKLDPMRVRLADWKLQVDPREEWHQMFLDAWRLHRDFAYDSRLRGVDWNGVRSRLELLVSRIGHRAELSAVLSQMAWHLGILHSQIGGGELPSDTENPEMGFLGAKLAAASGGMRIVEIDDSDPDIVAMRSPLRRPGVDVRENDVLTRIDGVAVKSQADVARALAGKVGQEVRLDYVRGAVARSAIVKPANFAGLFTHAFQDRVFETREAVDRATGGQIGYVALDAMIPTDVAQFARDFYAQADKPAMIIDVRNNSGGNVDSFIIAALLRRAYSYWTNPLGGRPYTNMQGAYRGHLAVLIDERTYSDGETFAAGIKTLGLAPLIGQRTAGAGIWLSGRNPLTDNGMARIAEYPQYRMDGEWLIEGYGVEPDIAVDNPPAAAFQGKDAQLQAGIDYLRNKLAAEPIMPLVPKPLPPVGRPGKSAIRIP